jgi:predicted nucleic acid-binding protein
MTNVVIDNSAAVELTRIDTNNTYDDTQYYAPELIDLEYANALRKLLLRHVILPEEARAYLLSWAGNGLIRCNHAMLLPRVWDHRGSITPYDASYVALAELLEIPLLTADRRLAKAAEAHCEVILVGG